MEKRKHLRTYYSDEKGCYVDEYSYMYRGRIQTIRVEYPAPSHLTFEEVQQLFIKQLDRDLVPLLVNSHLHE